ncbi:MAG: hypothetical protein NTW96_26220 [Planctomycetia bacterium]|nr:hypothetical protein [Planctomycetia bacterium]
MSPRKTLERDRKRFTLWLRVATADEREHPQTKMGKGAIAENRALQGENTPPLNCLS